VNVVTGWVSIISHVKDTKKSGLLFIGLEGALQKQRYLREIKQLNQKWKNHLTKICIL